MKLNRYFVLSVLLLGFSLAAPADLASIFTNLPPGQAPVLPRRPSMILIVCHGIGYGDLSCYGQTNYQTPNLDRLAAEGIRFTSYYAGNGDGSAGRAVLLTGRKDITPPATPDGDLPLTANDITVANRLHDVGYHTGFIGEWGLGDRPWESGFDEFAGCLGSAAGRDYFPPALRRYAAGLINDRTNNVHKDFNSQTVLYPNRNGLKGEFLPDLQVKMMLNFIKNNTPDQFNHYKPFFLVMDFSLPRSAAVGADEYPVPTDAPFSDEPWPQAAKNRAALLSRLDTGIGQLLEKLARPQYSNTVAVFFTSDAGPEKFADPKLNLLHPAGAFTGHRGELNEGALRVPMIARWPGHIPAGQTSDLPWAAWDFAPTALEIGFVLPPPGLSGTSVLPILSGEAITNREETLSWTLPGPVPARAARFGNWKVIQAGTHAPEMFNLTVDPQEKTNTPDAGLAAKFAALPQ